jgi:4-amino-4-deoxy-L-arabinose transferase-like glycosyltransferase
MTARAAGRAAAALAGPRGFAALLGLYLAVHVLLRVGLAPALTADDARDAFFAQSLEWGYLPKQPPLFNWLLLGAFRAFGVSAASVGLVKYALLGLAYGFVYLSGRRLLADARLAGLAAFSFLLMVPVSWVAHDLLTHSLAALACAAGTFHALLRLQAAPTRGAYAALGLALGLGLLAKFSYLFVAGALLLAALTVPGFRARLLDRRVLLSLGVAVALVGPYLAWFSAHRLSLAAMYAEEVRPETAGSYLGGVASGLSYLARVTAYYLAPLGAACLLLFPRGWLGRAAAPATEGGRLLERFLLVEAGLLAGGVLAGAVTYLKFRWVMPIYLLVPLWAFARLDRLGPPEPAVRRFGRLLVAAEAVVVLAFAASIWRGDLLGKPARFNTPYDRVAARLAAAGFSRGTIVTGGGALAGNLRLAFPDSRVLRLANAHYLPPPRPGPGGQCLLVRELEPRESGLDDVRAWAAAALGVAASDENPVAVIDEPFHFSRRHRFRAAYVLFPDGSGQCR